MSDNKLSPANYKVLSDLLYSISGLELGVDKEYLLESRLAAIYQEIGCKTLNDLALHLQVKKDSTLENRVAEAMTTNESLFFRDGAPFETLQKSLLPEIHKLNSAKKSLKIWSAACSTGQEPYSITMSILESDLSWTGWEIKILATDLSKNVLKRASEGRYSGYEIKRGMPDSLRDKYFTKEGHDYIVKPILKTWIDYQEMNLLSIKPNLGPFDFIFIRNVLIYFDLETKSKIIAQLRKAINPKGFLLLGSTESLLGLSDQFSRIEGSNSSIYVPI